MAIYRAGVGSPVLLAETVTNARGQFSANLPRQAADEIRYAVAANGHTELMTVMAATDRPHLRINEMTTVASAYAMAQFFDGKEISGKPLPLAGGGRHVPQSRSARSWRSLAGSAALTQCRRNQCAPAGVAREYRSVLGITFDEGWVAAIGSQSVVLRAGGVAPVVELTADHGTAPLDVELFGLRWRRVPASA